MIGAITAGLYGTGVPPVTNSYESIATLTGNGSSGTLTFSSIPSTFKHLQIRAIAKDTNTAGNTTLQLEMRFNGDTGSNYAYHAVRGDGSTAFTDADAPTTKMTIFNASLRESSATSTMAVSIIDILDYSSTSKNKTVRYLSGMNKNLGTTDDKISFGSNLWASTSAVNSISLIATSTAFTTSTQFALYGIKG